jgi:hypothetical protein
MLFAGSDGGSRRVMRKAMNAGEADQKRDVWFTRLGY